MQLPTSLIWTILTLLSPILSTAEGLASNNASLLWGPYRPNLYLGIRPRVPESLLMGLMWGRLEEVERRMAGYGWTAYDTRNGGTQTIHDAGNMIDIITEFVKISEGQSAGNWGLRVRGIPREDAIPGLKTSVVFYVAIEGMRTCGACQLEAVTTKKGSGDDMDVDAVEIQVKHPGLGASAIHIPNPIGSERNGRVDQTKTHEGTYVKSINATEDMLWQSKSEDLVIKNEPGRGNMHFVQLVFQDRFEFDILYSSKSATRSITSVELSREIQSSLGSCRAKFLSVFNPALHFGSSSYINFSHALFSNLLGGLGYFYGKTKVDESHAPEYDERGPWFWEEIAQAKLKAQAKARGPYELFTHVPSRPLFPRGFLWDEGFHLLPVLDWDIDLALEVVRSWLALMDGHGWIAGEQILGPEARSKVPPDFQIQYPHIANPPTLFLVLSAFIDRLSRKTKYFGHPSHYLQAETGQELLAEIYPLLNRHYDWFRRTQSGDVEAHSIPQASLGEGYRWRGRTPHYNFASGLDDYPRAEPPDPTELHLDALCWVGVMADALQKVAEFMKYDEDVPKFQSHATAIAQNIDVLHWSQTDDAYCDALVWEDQHSFTCAKGYISLFPFITGFLGPDHPHLNATLNLIYNDEKLWTHYGLRSLSPTSTLYGSRDNYWRSPIWININYLVIERLLDLASKLGPHQEKCRKIYTKLRRNVVETVYKSWLETGFAWEQYNPETGQGQRTQHFTGWTALVVKIMAFPDLENGNGVSGRIGSLIKGEGGDQRWSARGVVLVVLLVGFVHLTRRRFAGLWRSMTMKGKH
ncbi:glycoside hydrolase family 63 protein [Zopfia rhizophila CBS 207.26]|uniref:Mannosyl-oligosaccharide glucosidase n=1 Tax=Zopfia rhizophila CBS 207.26 TaxID=1314779 RepID=A0A6A6DF64_9PEZI|nr:glycoside hydrolase family 63 protein [Zopfia rhizophila CBS 207.26]